MKEIISDAEFRKRIEKNAIGGYLFFGEEDYLKLHALKTAREACCPDPSFAVFNDISIDCSSGDSFIDELGSAISMAPMMAEQKIITMTGLSVNDMKASEIDALCHALEALDEFAFNLLIISVPSGMITEGNLPKRPSPVLTKLCERLTPVRFEKVPTVKLCSWIVRHFAHHGVAVEQNVPNAIIERCGSDMFTLANEIEKLAFYVLSTGKKSVSLEDVPNITSANEEFDAFAFGGAIAEGNAKRALDILFVMKARREEPVVIMGELARTLGDMLAVKLLLSEKKSFSDIAAILDMHEYKVKLAAGNVRNLTVDELERAVALCANADMAIKLSQSGYLEIEKLICSL